jgi:hypothetical protein
MTPKVLLLFLERIEKNKLHDQKRRNLAIFLNKNFLDAFLALPFYKEFSRIILTVFIIFRFPRSFFLSELNCVNRKSKSDFPRSKKHNPSQGKMQLQTLELYEGGWFLSRKFQTSFIKKNVSLGAARDLSPHSKKQGSRFKAGVSDP